MRVTVCTAFQFEVVKVSVVEAAGVPEPEETFPSPVSPIAALTVTSFVGQVASFTVKVVVPPSATVSHGSLVKSGSAGWSTSAASSSSTICNMTSAGCATLTAASAAPLDAPDTATCLFVTALATVESTSSSTAAMVTVPVLVVAPAAMTSVLLALNLKSSAAA